MLRQPKDTCNQAQKMLFRRNNEDSSPYFKLLEGLRTAKQVNPQPLNNFWVDSGLGKAGPVQPLPGCLLAQLDCDTCMHRTCFLLAGCSRVCHVRDRVFLFFASPVIVGQRLARTQRTTVPTTSSAFDTIRDGCSTKQGPRMGCGLYSVHG